jgi:hypothetical protein
MILQRIQPRIDAVVPVSQAGFRKNCSFTEQVLALKSHMEAGFQRKLKTGVVFITFTFTEQYVVKTFLPSLSW